MYSWHEVFLSLTVFAFEAKENALLFCHNRQLFFFNRYHICDQFLWTCPQKNICIANWLLLLKKRLKSSSWKKTKSLAAKKSRISEDFLDLSTENRKFRRYSNLSLLSKWNESTEFSEQLSFSGSKVHPLKRNIKDRQRICFLFVDWANWKFFFFVEEMFRVSIVFLAFKRTLVIVLLQVRRMKVKATMRQISFGQKIRGKGKKLQYGWVSECWLWYDIGWALKVIANETQVLRTSPDTLWEPKRKTYLLSLISWLETPPSWEKAKRCVYGLGFGRKRPNPRPSPN